MRLAKIDWALGALLLAMMVGASACGSSSSSSSSASNLPSKIGKTEGQLNLVAWEGYAESKWVKPYEAKTGCKVHAKYAGSSDEMVTLMRQGGGQYDMVSASGDASLRLIRGGEVQPMNVALVPEWKNFVPQLQSPSHNTVDGKHYGISLQWGPNTLLYNTKSVTPAPTSWSAIYGPNTRARSRSRPTRSRSPTRRSICRRRSRAWASRTPTS
jgi:putative spermidine/putrescine transport system substrate-binding protein